MKKRSLGGVLIKKIYACFEYLQNVHNLRDVKWHIVKHVISDVTQKISACSYNWVASIQGFVCCFFFWRDVAKPVLMYISMVHVAFENCADSDLYKILHFFNLLLSRQTIIMWTSPGSILHIICVCLLLLSYSFFFNLFLSLLSVEGWGIICEVFLLTKFIILLLLHDVRLNYSQIWSAQGGTSNSQILSVLFMHKLHIQVSL